MDKKNIMVVDDSRTIAWIVRDTLEANGYAVRCVHSGEEALQRIEEQKPDIIILDIIMPKISGLEVLSKIKSSAETSSITVIMLTVNGRHDDILEGYRLGAEYYITKPFKQAELLHGVQRVLGRARQPSAA